MPESTLAFATADIICSEEQVPRLRLSPERREAAYAGAGPVGLSL